MQVDSSILERSIWHLSSSLHPNHFLVTQVPSIHTVPEEGRWTPSTTMPEQFNFFSILINAFKTWCRPSSKDLNELCSLLFFIYFPKQIKLTRNFRLYMVLFSSCWHKGHPLMHLMGASHPCLFFSHFRLKQLNLRTDQVHVDRSAADLLVGRVEKLSLKKLHLFESALFKGK